MADKGDKEYKKEIEILAEDIKRNSTNLPIVYIRAGRILNICGKLKDTKSATLIRNKAAEISGSIDKTAIEKAADEIIVLVSETLEQPKDERCINPSKVIKTPQYLKDCKKYAAENIADTEDKIQTFPYAEHIHGSITSGNWEGYWHARLSYNLRIMYHWHQSEKLLVYEAIITKNDL